MRPSHDLATPFEPAPPALSEDRKLVLKHANTFAVFDHYGDIRPREFGETGLYHEGTRFLSHLTLELNGQRPFLLCSGLYEAGREFSVTLTNPDLVQASGVRLPLGSVHIQLARFLWQGAWYQRLWLQNHTAASVRLTLAYQFDADFADLFEVRGPMRSARGRRLPTRIEEQRVTLAYEGLDGGVRRTGLSFEPVPAKLTPELARFELSLAARESATLLSSVECTRDVAVAAVPTFETAREQRRTAATRGDVAAGHARTSDPRVNAWLDAARDDLALLTTELPTGPYPYAGLPWFNAPFGRDGIITALQCLWLRPDVARGVLAYLAATQADRVAPERDAEPGKIVHEVRTGEMAGLGEVPFGRYYGSVDATPLFVVLAGAYHERTGDRELVAALWPNVEAALEWIERYGDLDRDGFVEYARRTESGLLHQGWKDSDDAIFHADGSAAAGPIALCEVQSYVYAAWRSAARLAAALGRMHASARCDRLAEALQRQFDSAFWCEELSSYALALDGDKRACRVVSSNAGQCLLSGIAPPAHAARVASMVLGPDLYSGWGIRTLSSREGRYNPMGYHLGCVWPHDNGLIALGLGRHGFSDSARRVAQGFFEATLALGSVRLPELFCGFSRREGLGPIPYPLACAPQAWAAAAVYAFVHASLGLTIDGVRGELWIRRPRLPFGVTELRIDHLNVGGAELDLVLLGRDASVDVRVLRREGEVRVILEK